MITTRFRKYLHKSNNCACDLLGKTNNVLHSICELALSYYSEGMGIII